VKVTRHNEWSSIITWGARFAVVLGLATLAGTTLARPDARDAARASKGGAADQPQVTSDEIHRIDVHVDDGIAVLEGTVDSKQEKKEAQQLAHVDGILGVNNRLAVRGAGK